MRDIPLIPMTASLSPRNDPLGAPCLWTSTESMRRSLTPSFPWRSFSQVSASSLLDTSVMKPKSPMLTARMGTPRGVPILAVNMGDFGFITEVSKNELRDTWEKFLQGRLGVSQRLMLSVEVQRQGAATASFLGLNEAVIGIKGISRMIRLKIFMSDTYMGRYRADGVIVATPTGSTAYSMAAGGPILHPEMEAFILTPICPFTLSNRPTVVPANEILRVEVEEPQKAETVLTIDGQESFLLQPRDCILIRRAPFKARIVHTDRRSFYEVLRTKLNWAGEPNA